MKFHIYDASFQVFEISFLKNRENQRKTLIFTIIVLKFIMLRGSFS